ARVRLAEPAVAALARLAGHAARAAALARAVRGVAPGAADAGHVRAQVRGHALARLRVAHLGFAALDRAALAGAIRPVARHALRAAHEAALVVELAGEGPELAVLLEGARAPVRAAALAQVVRRVARLARLAHDPRARGLRLRDVAAGGRDEAGRDGA